MFELPSQVPSPTALLTMRLMTQVLVAEALAFGTGSGGPNRQPGSPGYSGFVTPAEVQVRLLPVSVSVVLPMVKVPSVALQLEPVVMEPLMSGTTEGTGTLTPEPPK